MDVTGSLGPRQQVEVWVHGTGPERLMDVRWSKDSLYGMPYLAGLDGENAKPVIVARSQVDSIRTGQSSAGTWKVAGILFASVAVVTIAACASTRCSVGE